MSANKVRRLGMMRLVIAMPVYEDWESAALLCEALHAELARLTDVHATLLLIDDGSTRQIGTDAAPANQSLDDVWVLRLRRNLGHQRAIAVALAYIHENIQCEAVIIMDADGEDRPAEIPRLIQSHREATFPVTIFVERGRRIESLAFRAYYQIYRFFHLLLTGRGI